jgi:hypothetical protein
MIRWLLIALLLTAALGAFDWQLVIRMAQKLANVTAYGLVGWAFSRAAFAMLTPNGSGRLEEVDPDTRDAAVQGRSIIIGAAMIAGALGL